MKAIVVREAGEPEVLQLCDLPMPQPAKGQVLIKVEAFGLNRSEMFTRQGHSPSVVFPRVLGIECVGRVVEAPGAELDSGQMVMAMMGGMGRQYDGGYAQYTCVPAEHVFAVESNLSWEELGTVPEMFQTASGSLSVGLGLEQGQTLLVRGGTSSVGMTATVLAKLGGATVLATTRNPAKREALLANGVDHVVIDDGTVAADVRELVPGGVDKTLELIGTTTLLDSLAATRVGGVVCMTGILGNAWAFENFAPMEAIPTGVRLTAYSGNGSYTSASHLQGFLDSVAAGRARLNIDRVFEMDEIVQAHRYMESNKARGKLVVRVRHQ